MRKEGLDVDRDPPPMVSHCCCCETHDAHTLRQCCCCSTQRALNAHELALRAPKHESRYRSGRRRGRHNLLLHRPLMFRGFPGLTLPPNASRSVEPSIVPMRGPPLYLAAARAAAAAGRCRLSREQQRDPPHAGSSCAPSARLNPSSAPHQAPPRAERGRGYK
jgi:hypothetical protein